MRDKRSTTHTVDEPSFLRQESNHYTIHSRRNSVHIVDTKNSCENLTMYEYNFHAVVMNGSELNNGSGMHGCSNTIKIGT